MYGCVIKTEQQSIICLGFIAMNILELPLEMIREIMVHSPPDVFARLLLARSDFPTSLTESDHDRYKEQNPVLVPFLFQEKTKMMGGGVSFACEIQASFLAASRLLHGPFVAKFSKLYRNKEYQVMYSGNFESGYRQGLWKSEIVNDGVAEHPPANTVVYTNGFDKTVTPDKKSASSLLGRETTDLDLVPIQNGGLLNQLSNHIIDYEKMFGLNYDQHHGRLAFNKSRRDIVFETHAFLE
jgi:hypothetical protein